MSPVGFEGGQRELFVVRALGNWAEEHGGVCASLNAGFTLPDGSVRSLDASWLSDTRWSSLSNEARRRFSPVCPEFLVEILSEADTLPALQQRCSSGLQAAHNLPG